MARNKLSDLKDHLFAQMERLNDETIKPEHMEQELGKAKAMEGIAKSIIEIEKTNIQAGELVFRFMEAGYNEKQIPLLSND